MFAEAFQMIFLEVVIKPQTPIIIKLQTPIIIKPQTPICSASYLRGQGHFRPLVLYREGFSFMNHIQADSLTL